jgi:FkbM family methyltransferase
MPMNRAVKAVIRRAISAAGYELTRKRESAPASGVTLADALARLEQRGPDMFKSVIDVGASDGRWSQQLMAWYPRADYLLIEAQPVHEPRLKAFCARHRNARYVLMAAGAARGHTYFDASDPFGGVACEVAAGGSACIRVPVTTIDDQVKIRGMPPPYLIKLDVHGYELPILSGASQTIRATNVCVIECYNFPMTVPGSLLFPDMVRHLGGLGFRCADVFDFLYRPKDNLFWQMDVLFMRAGRPEFSYAGYR